MEQLEVEKGELRLSVPFPPCDLATTTPPLIRPLWISLQLHPRTTLPILTPSSQSKLSRKLATTHLSLRSTSPPLGRSLRSMLDKEASSVRATFSETQDGE